MVILLLLLLACPNPQPPDTGPGSGAAPDTGDTAELLDSGDTGDTGEPDTADTGDTGPDPDADGDGDGYSPNAGDCDDTRAHVYPGAPDACDGLDADCDGEPIPPGSCGLPVDPTEMWTWSVEKSEVGMAWYTRLEWGSLGDVTGDGAGELGMMVNVEEDGVVVRGVLGSEWLAVAGAHEPWPVVGWSNGWPEWNIDRPHRADDTDGDGLADLLFTSEAAGGHTDGVFLVLGRVGGFGDGVADLESTADAMWVAGDGVKFADGLLVPLGTGEVDGDGLADFFLRASEGGGTIDLRVPGSLNPGGVHTLGDLPRMYAEGRAHTPGGDLDGDGLTDFADMYWPDDESQQVIYSAGADWVDDGDVGDVASLAWDSTPTPHYGLSVGEADYTPPADIDGDGLDDGLLNVTRPGDPDTEYCVLLTTGGIPSGDVNEWVFTTLCSGDEHGVGNATWIADLDRDGASDIKVTSAGYDFVSSGELRQGGVLFMTDLRFVVSASGSDYLFANADLTGDGLPEWTAIDDTWRNSAGELVGRALIMEGFEIPWEDDSKW